MSISHEAEPLGCAPGGGCDVALTSQWSKWLGIPVAIPATLLYAAMFVSSCAMNLRAAGLARTARQALLVCATTATVAAGWFIYVQFKLLGGFCPYCIATHAAGLTASLLVVTAAIIGRDEHDDESNAQRALGITPQRGIGLVLIGLLLSGTLIAGQWFTSTETDETPTPPPISNQPQHPVTQHQPTATQHQKPAALPERSITILNGKITLDLTDGLVLGDPNAPHIVVLVFDYTCPHCHKAHLQLESALQRYPGQLAVLALPFPLDADCNPLVPQTHAMHTNACEITQAVWATSRTDPAAAAQLDHWITSHPKPPHPDAVREQANAILRARGSQTLTDYIPMDQMMERATDVYRAAGKGAVPKMIFGQAVIKGPATSNQQLHRLLEEQLGLLPPP